jgi:sialate O-acetylesterase
MSFFPLLSLALASAGPPTNTFRFANTQGDHMVLQQAPQQATIWGFGTAGASVSVSSTAVAAGGSDDVETTVAADGECAILVLQLLQSPVVVFWPQPPPLSAFVALAPPLISFIVSCNESAGTWQVALAPVKASNTPVTITAKSGAATITLSDVLYGDVWFCSGQSNMQVRFPLQTQQRTNS